MKLRELVIRSMMKNMKHYYLYFFALIFSVTLYFSFKTLRYNEQVLKNVGGESMAAAGFEVATYLLYFIILVFVLYANAIFMKRRSKEIGLYQLIGMTKGLIFRLIAIENMILFSGAVLIGIVAGFLASRLLAMILFKIIGESNILGISFSWEAAVMTLVVFAAMLVVILIQQFVTIHRQSLLQMFQAANQSDETIRTFSIFHMVMGFIGIGCIAYGYTQSTVLFEGEGSKLMVRMLMVLFSTILGTFLIFRYSVALFINLWRKRKKGFLSRTDIVALMPIMHRMKSSASSLTLIAVLTAVSLGINTLAFISYYSVDKMTTNMIPEDFISLDERAIDFTEALDEEGITYEYNAYPYGYIAFDFAQLLKNERNADSAGFDISGDSRVIAGSLFGYELTGNEAIVANFNGYTAELMDFEANRTVTLQGANGELYVKELVEDSLLLGNYGLTMSPVILVSNEKYNAIMSGTENYNANTEHHVHLLEDSQFEQANALYKETNANVREVLPTGDVRLLESQQGLQSSQLQGLGLTIFITAFLGLAFLFASGSILYFKQMSEADMESGSYTILRKIGYSEQDLMNAIYRKQLFNFGVPVSVGLFHSYFAVKSGWWFFGTEFATPMAIMMILYVVIYIVFAIITIRYYRAVVRRSF